MTTPTIPDPDPSNTEVDDLVEPLSEDDDVFAGFDNETDEIEPADE